MRQLKLIDDERYRRVTVQVWRDGEFTGVEAARNFLDPKHYRMTAAALDVPAEFLKTAVLKFKAGGRAELTVDVPGEPAPTPFYVEVRGRTQPAAAATRFEMFADALAAKCDASGPLITWRDRSKLCAVDIDLSARDAFERFAPSIRPRPGYWWTTHGGGLRLIYDATETLTADELGALASLSVLRRCPAARVELKTDTRHPGYPRGEQHCGVVHVQTPDADTSNLATWFLTSECPPERRDEYLAGRGLELGRRYPHEHCPLEPHEPGQRDPVFVGEEGITCHACAGRGVKFGGPPGFFPYRALVGTSADSTLRVMVENFAHWSHVKHCLDVPDGVGELVYRAALKLRHEGDSRVSAAFAVGRGIMRLEQGWATVEGEPLTRNIEPILAELPAVRDADGAPIASKVALFAQPSVDLSGHGYPAVSPVYGCRIASHFLDVAGFTKVFQLPSLRGDAARELRPTYLPAKSRPFDKAAAWRIIEEVFPGVSRPLIQLLIAARGCAEIHATLPPFLFVSGPSSAGKTGAVMLAASIVGDGTTSVQWQRNSERVRQGVLQAKSNGSYVLLNEIIKDGQRDKSGVEETLDFLLNLTPDSVSHRLYVGPVRLGWLPVVVLTDTVVPAEVKQSKQLARRLIHCPLYRTVEWEKSLQTIGRFDRFRVADPRYAAAGNVILSGVVDDFFREPLTLKDIAAELGFACLDATPESDENRERLRLFFRAVCNAPDLKPLPAGMGGRGWKAIDVYSECDATNLWRELGERKVTETAWGQLIGAKGEVECETRSSRGRVLVRFVADRRTQKDYKVNGEIVADVTMPPVELEPRTLQDGIYRPGNTIDGEPTGFGDIRLPAGLID